MGSKLMVIIENSESSKEASSVNWLSAKERYPEKVARWLSPEYRYPENRVSGEMHPLKFSEWADLGLKQPKFS